MIVLVWRHVYYRSGWLWEMTKVAQRRLAWLYITFGFASIILLCLQIVCNIIFLPFPCIACSDSEKICRFQRLNFSSESLKVQDQTLEAVSKFSIDFSKAACGDFLPSSRSLFWEEEKFHLLAKRKIWWKRGAVVSSHSAAKERYLWEKGCRNVSQQRKTKSAFPGRIFPTENRKNLLVFLFLSFSEWS